MVHEAYFILLSWSWAWQDQDQDSIPRDQDQDNSPRDQDQDQDSSPRDQDQDSSPRDQDQDQDSKKSVSRLSRDETVFEDFPSLTLVQVQDINLRGPCKPLTLKIKSLTVPSIVKPARY